MKKLLLTISLMLMTSGAMAVLTSPDPDLISDRGIRLIRRFAFDFRAPYDANTIQLGQSAGPGRISRIEAFGCRHFREIGQPGRDIQVGWGHRLAPDDFSPDGVLHEMGIHRNRFFLPNGAIKPGSPSLSPGEANELLRRDVMRRVDYRDDSSFQVIDRRTGRPISDILQSLEVHQKDALASLIFDIGLKKFRNSRLLKGIIERKPDDVFAGFADSAEKSDLYFGKEKILRRFIELGIYIDNPMPPVVDGRVILPSRHYRIRGDARKLDELWTDLISRDDAGGDPGNSRAVFATAHTYRKNSWSAGGIGPVRLL